MKNFSVILYIKRTLKNRFNLKSKNVSKRPRLSVFKSGRHIYAQVIDDVAGKTIASFSTLNKSLKTKKTWGMEGAVEVGTEIAKLAIKAGVKDVVLDRGGYPYHGKIKAFADAAREAGLNF